MMLSLQHLDRIIKHIELRDKQGHFTALINSLITAEIVVKSKFNPTKSKTVKNTIYLNHSFLQKQIQQQAQTLLHEAMHLKHWQENHDFLSAYFFYPSFRFQVESEAEKAETYWLCMTGYLSNTPALKDVYALDKAKSFMNSYFLWGFVTKEKAVNTFKKQVEDYYKGEPL